MAKKINWEEKIKKLGYKTVPDYLMRNLPVYGQDTISMINNVSAESVRNQMAKYGIRCVKIGEYVRDKNYKKVRIKKEKIVTTDHEDAINMCIPDAERLAKDVGIPFLEAMNRITIAKGLRHSKEWILEQREVEDGRDNIK